MNRNRRFGDSPRPHSPGGTPPITTLRTRKKRRLVFGIALAAVQLVLVPRAPGHTGSGSDQSDPPQCGDCGCPPGGGGPGGNCQGGAGGYSLTCFTRRAAFGVPEWWISEPHVNLRLEDTPLGYRPARGAPVAFNLSYRQRGAVEEDPNIFGVGTNWSCSFRVYLLAQSPTVWLHKGGAGWIPYQPGVTQYRDGSILTTTSSGYEIDYADGSVSQFTNFFSAGVGFTYFLTSQSDPAANTTIYTYSNTPSFVQLLSVSDPDGNATTLQYKNASFPLQITAVVDPFSRTNFLYYDSAGYLTNMTDVIGLSSSFAYDAGTRRGWITNLTTPYGSTAFRYGGVDADNGTFSTDTNAVNRFVEVTLPTLGKELYLYRQDCTNFMVAATYSPTPTIYVLGNGTLDNVDQNYRNSFHWDSFQYTGLSTNYLETGDVNNLTASDYALGRLYHWLKQSSTGTDPSETLSLERAPSTAQGTSGQITWYDYDGKTSGNNVIGTNALPCLKAWVLPDLSTRYTHFSRNWRSLVTQTIGTYTALDGSVALRTNSFYYGSNAIDLCLEVGPENEQVVSNYFSAGNTIHLPDASSDALNQQTTYAYNSYGLVTSIHGPAGLTTTNTYVPSGNGLNRLQKSIDLEISRTNSYTYYANGLVQNHTDERGLTTTSYWDALQRLTGTGYPNGATSNLYTLLDLTATKDRLGHWSYFAYNALRQKVAETNANGVVTRYGYCDCGFPAYVTNAWGTAIQQVISLAHDYQGNLTYEYYPDFTRTNWPNAMQQIFQTGDGRGTRYLSYNNQGLLTNLSNVYGTEKATAFDNEDRPVYVTDANGVMLTNTFDLLGRLLTRGYPDGGIEKFGYSARGLTAYTNQIGMASSYFLDPAGRKTSEVNANNETNTFTYNAAGDLLTLTDGKGHTTTWGYDIYGRVTNKLDQTGTQILAYAYDPESRLTNRWSVAKGNTAYSYDAVGNLTNIAYPVSPRVQFVYDALNHVTTMVDAAGTTAYGYTSGGQLWTEDGPFASDTVTNSYQNRLRLALALQQPTGLWTNGFVYDAAGRLTNVMSPAGGFGYALGTPGTLLRQLYLPNTSYITNTFDSVARLTGTFLKNSGNTVLDSASYGYNLAGQRLNFTNAGGTFVQYGYDNIGQLKVADSSVNTEDRGYTYDKAWNLNWLTNAGTVSQFQVDTRNELTNWTFGPCLYDANGNLTNKTTDAAGDFNFYIYGDENRLIDVQNFSV
ncbi:MAG TPA: hypothetical protein VJA21_31970, partial [Verrucomicrobiae bacterium]